MTKLYIFIVGVLVVVSAVIYSTVSYKDKQYQKHEQSYKNEINTLKSEKNTLAVAKKEATVKKAFTKKVKKIVKKSNETKTYTKKMMEDKDVQEFDDSF